MTNMLGDTWLLWLDVEEGDKEPGDKARVVRLR
jgi:hypothetical protein